MYCITKMTLISPNTSALITLSTFHSVWWVFVTACSAFLKIYTSSLSVWNPCVRKLVNFPSPSATYTGFLGFGFDPKTKDYRVVRFVTSEDSHGHHFLLLLLISERSCPGQ
ncbi:hypothetical protein ACB092_09G200100 [Castanea dentata]